jgi:ABC-2 type transport system permease protein
MGAKTLLSHSFRIAWKDTMELFRNKMMLVMLILMPLFMMVMVGFIYSSDASMSNVPIALANQDSGYSGSFVGSQTFTAALQQINDNTGMMKLSSVSCVDEIKTLVKNGEIDGGILIPSNFTESILTGQQGAIIIITDQSNPQMSATIQVVLANLFDQMGTMLAQQTVLGLNTSGVNYSNSLAIVKPYIVATEGIVEGTPSYFDFIAPGIMAMTVMMSVMTGLPAAISQEKEVGTLDGMMVAPINRLSVILGKTLAQTARGLLQGVIILLLAVGLFGVTIHGNILLVFGLLFLGVFSFVGLGIVLTSFAKDQETATMMMTMLMFPMMFLSGVFFPIAQMPWFMQSIASFLPLTYVAAALRKVMVLGAGIPAISTELMILIVFGAVMIAIAVPVFKRAMTR